MDLNYCTKGKNTLGDAIYHDVVILSNGVWDQENKKSQIFYPLDVLRTFASNWKRKFIYMKHTSRKDGVPVHAGNIVGFVENPHFDNRKKAIVADLRIFNSTTSGKDAIEYIDKGVVQFVSPEVWTKDHYSYGTQRRVATEISFNGVALVIDNPACKDASIDRFRKTYKD